LSLFPAFWIPVMKSWINFKRPKLVHLHALRVVLDRKVLLLVSWETKNCSRIFFRPGKFRSRISNQAAILSLPAGADTCKVILWNKWHRSSFSIPLQHLVMQSATWENFLLLSTFNSAPSIGTPNEINIPVLSLPPFPNVRLTKIHLLSNPIEFQTSKLAYESA
jgi:hypothetical protein